MAKLVDKSGAEWGVMKTTDSKGRQYIVAYQNAWKPGVDGKKGRSYRVAKKQVGRLCDDGQILVSPAFLELFPQYKGRDLYWGDKELVEQQAFEKQATKPTVVDISWSMETIRVGLTYAVWEYLKKSRMLDDLVETFGEESARLLAALVAYLVDTNDVSLQSFEDWIAEVWLPELSPADAEHLTDLLSGLTPAKIQEFFAKRIHRLTTTVAFDCTSASFYPKATCI